MIQASTRIKTKEDDGMRRMLSAAVMMCTIALLSTLLTAVYATPSEPVSGSFDYTFEITGMRGADGNTFLYATEWEDWEGDFTGTSVAVFRVEMFRSGFWNVWLRSTFTGTVNGKSGTAVIQLVGKKSSGEDWYGQWVILSGTGDLANLRGQGTWWGPGYRSDTKIPGDPDIYYSGKIHFKPS